MHKANRQNFTARLTLLLAIFPLFFLGKPASAQCPAYNASVVTGNAGVAELTEASGLAASRRNHGVLWSHNDSGGQPRVYAMSRSGTHLATYTLSGASAMDWEDIAIGPGPTPGIDYLYVGDIGDNNNNRTNITVYRVAEPLVDQHQSLVTGTLTGVETFTLQYADGSRDAETLMVDVNADIYIVSKRVTSVGRVYRAAYPQSTSSTIVIPNVASLPWGGTSGALGATGGDIAADGSAVIVRRYSVGVRSSTMWLRAPGQNLWEVFATAGCNINMPFDGQGEAVTFAPNSLTLYTIAEGASSPIYMLKRNPTPGDVNKDGVTNIIDLTGVILGWGSCVNGQLCPADVDNSTVVDISDLTAVILNWS